ncbi:prolyl aminopeptidase [Gordonia sp. C13]|uniref:prolyl aminopeptidase n=1 Tax=Gordonia sp. C13 TaxID=2935078 RepID=UPI00200A5D62|nr:prolyl aminopeptidase [Gordonia sp. C13]MCK8615308.1 prolyl aminopeptidase [Gordonia sp. C13]
MTTSQRPTADWYAQIEANATGFLETESQSIYWEESGNPDGMPAVVLHGGPGGGSQPHYRRYFDPDRYRIIQMDQRGCGRSHPHAGDWASLSGNNTWALVADLELLRTTLKVQSWLVFGGSWGSTLALAYAQQYPERVRALVLRGIFLIRPHELYWFYGGGGANLLFPDYWRDYCAQLDPNRPVQTAIAQYHELLEGPDRVAATDAAIAWTRWEALTSTLLPDPAHVAAAIDPRNAIAFARIENHYFRHAAFLSPNQLLEHAGALKGIPSTIVHGRYDVVCPIGNAFDLHAQLPHSELIVVDDAGHSMNETGIRRALVGATDRFAD